MSDHAAVYNMKYRKW